MSAPSLQDRFAPSSRCFGCGPSNERGLRIKSHVDGDALVATFTPEPHHEAFPGVVNGGILGALLDCHSNWAAAHAIMSARGLAAPLCTVTAEFAVKLRRPTPLGPPLLLRARAVAVEGDRVNVEATLEADGKVTATCTGVFVAVKEGHPAYHRWGLAPAGPPPRPKGGDGRGRRVSEACAARAHSTSAPGRNRPNGRAPRRLLAPPAPPVRAGKAPAPKGVCGGPERADVRARAPRHVQRATARPAPGRTRQ